MTNIWEKVTSILMGSLNLGHSYLITTVPFRTFSGPLFHTPATGQVLFFWHSIKFQWGMSIHQKLGIILESEVVQKLSLEKNDFTKKWSPKLIFLNENFFWKISVDFWHRKLTLKVQGIPR